MHDVVEVIARLGETIVEVAHVERGRTYRIGTAPGVDLALPVAQAFPLVDADGVVRVPIGVPAREVGDGAIEMTIGMATVTVRRAGAAAGPVVPRAAVEKRMAGYGGVVLALHLGVWAAAMIVAPFVPPVIKVKDRARPPRLARIAEPHVREPAPPPKPPPPEPEPKPQPQPQPTSRPAAHAAIAASPRDSEAADPGGEHAGPGHAATQSAAELAAQLEAIHVTDKIQALSGPTYDPADEEAQGFGGGHHFNADEVAPKETYKVTRWALPTFMHVKGVLAPVPAIEMCDEDSCLTRGPIEVATVIKILHKHEAEIARCYREHTGDLVGNIRIRFAIGSDGKVSGEYGTPDGPVGYGTGIAGRCVAQIAQKIRWPKASAVTWVFVGIAFRPA